MKIFYTDHFTFPIPEGYSFPVEKYALIRKRVVESRIVEPASLSVPPPATDEELLRVHESNYLVRVIRGELTSKEMRRIGLPWSPSLVARSRRSCGATLQACRVALRDGMAISLSGGTHHAFADRGEGYCVFNDCAVSARAMQHEGRARRVLIIDCDVHQGNGSAAIFRGDETVFTFSIHGANNFPYRKEQSDLDIPLQDGTGDAVYLKALREGLHGALEKAGADLAIYIAGADPYGKDRYGRLNLTKAGLGERDALVFRTCRERGLPIVVTMGGGYARRIQDTVDIHVRTVQTGVSRGAHLG